MHDGLQTAGSDWPGPPPAPPRRPGRYALSIAFALAVVAAWALLSVEMYPAVRGPSASALAARSDPGGRGETPPAEPDRISGGGRRDR